MPIYEYQCLNCKIIFEDFNPLPGKKTLKCPECGGIAKKIISKVTIAYYSSGFKAPTGIISEDGSRELDPKRHDVFGRHIDEMPDEQVKARSYYKWMDEYEKKYRTKPPLTLRDQKIQEALGGKDVSKEV